jgi:excisionase family DNA binding protein
MTAQPPREHLPFGARKQANGLRLAVTVAEACEALGVSWDFWREHVAPELRIVRRGRRKLVPVSELSAWLERNAEVAVPVVTGSRPPTVDVSPANRGARTSRAPVGEAA